jgi:WXXGXW repeat (2 copies)
MHSIRSLRIVAFAMLVTSLPSLAQMRISVSFGPPAIPVYEQPLCPGEGYIWTPGYWAWDDVEGDYYWVPGTWVLAPEVGFLWTPPYWAWDNGAYVFYDGYWGPQVGFYGGIVYGFGYFGSGYVGGRWQGNRFFYNRSVNNVNVVNVRNVYNETVINNNVTVNRVSYNGGPGGVQARPRPEEEAARRARHLPPVAAQSQHLQTARSERELHASANRGKPPVAATAKPAAFRDRSVVPATAAGAPYNPPANGRGAKPRPGNTPANAVHPRDLPPLERPVPAENPKYQQQQQKVLAKQEHERQKLQRKQDQEDQRVQRQNADQARRQQIEQRHQQQTQQLQQRHAQQQQRIEERQPPPPKR